MPQWDFFMQSQGCNFTPHADHHSFIKCLKPTNIQEVISQAAGNDLLQHHKNNSTKPLQIPLHWIHTMTLNVHSPEDSNKTRTMPAKVVIFPKKRKTSTIQHYKGKVASSTLELSSCYFFKDGTTNNIDINIVLGKFDLEDA